MVRKIEKVEIVEVEALSSSIIRLHVDVTLNQEAKDFLLAQGRYFQEESMSLLHTLQISKKVYEGDADYRNKKIAFLLRDVKCQFEDCLDLSDISLSTNADHDVKGFCLGIDTDKLIDKNNAVLEEEVPPPPETEEDPV